MPAPPTASRPAPPAVPPVVHDGVRFEQDLSAMPPSGAAAGGGLAAATGASGASAVSPTVSPCWLRSSPCSSCLALTRSGTMRSTSL